MAVCPRAFIDREHCCSVCGVMFYGPCRLPCDQQPLPVKEPQSHAPSSHFRPLSNRLGNQRGP